MNATTHSRECNHTRLAGLTVLLGLVLSASAAEAGSWHVYTRTGGWYGSDYNNAAGTNYCNSSWLLNYTDPNTYNYSYWGNGGWVENIGITPWAWCTPQISDGAYNHSHGPVHGEVATDNYWGVLFTVYDSNSHVVGGSDIILRRNPEDAGAEQQDNTGNHGVGATHGFVEHRITRNSGGLPFKSLRSLGAQTSDTWGVTSLGVPSNEAFSSSCSAFPTDHHPYNSPKNLDPKQGMPGANGSNPAGTCPLSKMRMTKEPDVAFGGGSAYWTYVSYLEKNQDRWNDNGSSTDGGGMNQKWKLHVSRLNSYDLWGNMSRSARADLTSTSGLNIGNYDAQSPRITVAGNVPYVAWTENSATKVKYYNMTGTTWYSVSTSSLTSALTDYTYSSGTTYGVYNSGYSLDIATVQTNAGERPVIAVADFTGGGEAKIKLQIYNGTSFVNVATNFPGDSLNVGLNSNGVHAMTPRLSAVGTYLYVTWNENNLIFVSQINLANSGYGTKSTWVDMSGGQGYGSWGYGWNPNIAAYPYSPDPVDYDRYTVAWVRNRDGSWQGSRGYQKQVAVASGYGGRGWNAGAPYPQGQGSVDFINVKNGTPSLGDVPVGPLSIISRQVADQFNATIGYRQTGGTHRGNAATVGNAEEGWYMVDVNEY